MSDPAFGDEDARPSAPPVPGLTEAQRALGDRLSAIHRMYRQEMSAIARLMEQVRTGLAAPAAVAPALAGLALTRNLTLFGTVCGQECAVLAMHHDIEEQHMFPALALDAPAGLRPVLDRLTREHGVIHGMLVDLNLAARRLAEAPGAQTFTPCAEAFQRLDRALQSHFGYEERELGPAIGYLGIEI